MADNKVIALPQVALHKSKKDCWVVINGRVLDVTKFLDEHPGGEEVILEVAGKDATKEFDDVGHSNAAKKLLSKYQVGVLPGYAADSDTKKEPDSTTTTTKAKEMTAFVIKDKDSSKSAFLLDFVVPLLVAASYFGYSYLARSTQISSS